MYKRYNSNERHQNGLDRFNDCNQYIDELFSEGDCLYFCFRSKELFLYNLQKDTSVSITVNIGNTNKYCMYFQFNYHDAEKVNFTVEPVFQKKERVDCFV